MGAFFSSAPFAQMVKNIKTIKINGTEITDELDNLEENTEYTIEGANQTYTIGKPLYFPNGVTLRGFNITLLFSGANILEGSYINIRGNGVKLKGITFRLDQSSYAPEIIGVDYAYNDLETESWGCFTGGGIKDCTIEGWGTGIRVFSGWQRVFQNVALRDNGVGMLYDPLDLANSGAWSTSGDTLLNLTFEGNYQGLVMTYAHQMSVQHCVFEYNTIPFEVNYCVGFFIYNSWLEQNTNKAILRGEGLIVGGRNMSHRGVDFIADGNKTATLINSEFDILNGKKTIFTTCSTGGNMIYNNDFSEGINGWYLSNCQLTSNVSPVGQPTLKFTTNTGLFTTPKMALLANKDYSLLFNYYNIGAESTVMVSIRQWGIDQYGTPTNEGVIFSTDLTYADWDDYSKKKILFTTPNVDNKYFDLMIEQKGGGNHCEHADICIVEGDVSIPDRFNFVLGNPDKFFVDADGIIYKNKYVKSSTAPIKMEGEVCYGKDVWK